MINKNLLLSIMVLHGDTQEKLAVALNTTKTWLSRKINGKTQRGFDTKLIQAIKERYQLSSEQIGAIFFPDED